MIKINKFILIICFLVLLLIFIICKNDILYFFNNSTNKLLGGNTDTIINATVQPSLNNVINATVESNTNSTLNTTAESNANASTTMPTYTPLDINNDVASLEDTLRNEEMKINKIRDELESLRRNRVVDNVVETNRENTDYVTIKRDIIENNSANAIDTIVSNESENENNSDISDVEEEELSNNDVEKNNKKEKTTRAWQNMCENDYNNKRKKHKFMDLKLDLNTENYLQPFNNDDYGEYGQFNC
jgi:hypothetical protein